MKERFANTSQKRISNKATGTGILSQLTPRENEILFWIARGKSNSEIANILEIKPATVGKHLEHIYPKLGVENRTAAASFVPRHRL